MSSTRPTAARARTGPVAGVRLGLVGSVVLAVAAWAGAPLREPERLGGVPVLGWLRTTHAGHMVGLALFAAGVTALLLAWLRVGRSARGRPVAELWRVGAVWAAPLLVVPPLASRDVYSYLAQGALARHGIDPYVQGPAALPGTLFEAVGSTWADTPAPYGPAFVALSREVSRATDGGLWSGVAVMRVLAVAGCVAAAVLVRALAAQLGSDPATATWMVALNPLLLVHLVAGMHNEALVLPLVLAAVLLALRGLPVAGAGALGLAVSVKLTAVVVAPFVALLWAGRGGSRPSLARVAACQAWVAALVGGVLAGLSLLTGLGFGWVGAAGASAGTGSRLSLTTSLGEAAAALASAAGHPHAGTVVQDGVRVLGLLVAAAIVVGLLVWVGRAMVAGGVTAGGVVARSGAAVLAVALLGPLLHPWYLLPGLALLAVAGSGRRGTAVVVWSTLVGSVLLRAAGGEVLHANQPVAAACAALALLVVVREHRLRG